MRLSVASLSLCAFMGPALVSALPRSSSHQISRRASGTDYAGYAQQAVGQLQKWYNETSGLWGQTWWNSANVVTMLADYQECFPSAINGITAHVFPVTFARAPSALGYTNFLNDYYDDELWWALAWIKVYEVTGQQQYLDQASVIFEDAKKVWGTSTCGALWWDKPHTQVNAIANTLYFTTAAKLANLKPKAPAEFYYLNEAIRSYNWLLSSGLLNEQSLLNDGLDLTTCKNNNGQIWTYNQGVILAGLVEMTWATGNTMYNNIANSIALSTISTLVNQNGILVDPCEPNDCGGDGSQFKGIFVRNLQFMVNRATVLPADTKEKYVNFLRKNADSIWAYDNDDGGLGLVWGGPDQVATVQTQSSAMDALVAAGCVSP